MGDFCDYTEEFTNAMTTKLASEGVTWSTDMAGKTIDLTCNAVVTKGDNRAIDLMVKELANA